MLKQVIEVVVAAREDRAPGLAVFDLVRDGGGRLPLFEAGAHVEAHIAEGLVRPYSLCGDPADRERYRLGILLDPASRGGSRQIFDEWHPGHRVKVSQPRNLFPLAAQAAHHIMIGGGIGVTPQVAMTCHLAGAGKSFELHYCVRQEERAVFLPDLRALAGDGTIIPHFSVQRRFDLKADVGPPRDGAHIYVCGPQAFMDSIIAEARRLGWEDSSIHYEFFDVDVDLIGAPFAVETRDGRTFEVPPDRSIAEVLMAEGFDIDISCEKGICGSCITDVVEGEPDHRDHYLTDEEKARNDCIALCCSRAKGARLKLAL